MRPQINFKGIVLSSTLLGDYDKRVVILTKERGKITAFARNVRRPGNILMAVCQPFNYGTFSVYESYDAYKLVGAQIDDYFTEVKEDLERVCYGRYFCEIIDYLTVEGNCDKDVLNLLYISFKALIKQKHQYELIRRIFEIKMLAIDGEAIHGFGCVKCDKKDNINHFNAGIGGFLCDDCKKQYQGTVDINESTVYAIQYILSSPISKLYMFNVTDNVLEELKMIVNRYLPLHMDKKFKSLEILDVF